MIAKNTKGKGFRGALEYDLKKEKGNILSTNMAGQTPKELAAEFGVIRQLRPNLGKAVLHVSISAAHGEHLTDTQWNEIGHRYLKGMGFTDNQYVITRHTDTEHEHIHIIANRIMHNGEVVSDSHDYRRQETLMREIEKEWGLQTVEPSKTAQRKAPTKGEIEQGIRTGQPSTRQQLQQLCDAAAKESHSYTDYQTRLEAAGIELIPVVQLGGTKLSGISYRLDGITMKGSDLGKSYTAAGIQKRGISYEQNRDLEAARRSIERETHRTTGEQNRKRETSRIEPYRGISRNTGTPGASHGSIDRRNEADTGRNRTPEQTAIRAISAANQGNYAALQRSRETSAESSQQPEQRGPADGMEALRHGSVGRNDYSAARDRVLALAGPSQSAELPGREKHGGIPPTRPDRSLEAVQKQIAALGSTRFEVGIRDSKTGQMLNREWSRAEVEQSLPWLKRMNARGNDIYIRPAGEHGLVLVDDLKREALAQMKLEGWTPAATIETSPDNYQAWVKLSEQPQPAEIRRYMAQELARHYGGDPNSADSRHYGRLAGFTNHKPEHERDGKQPYVLAHECPAKPSKKAVEALQQVSQWVDQGNAEKERQRRLNALEVTKPEKWGYGWQQDPTKEYTRQAQRLLRRYGQQTDHSRMDWMIATDMAKSGRFTQQDIERGLCECSPNIESRKAGHIEDYAKRTAERAWNAPEVREQRQERERQRKRDRDGPEMER